MTRVVLVHERITEIGGSEKVVDEFARIATTIRSGWSAWPA